MKKYRLIINGEEVCEAKYKTTDEAIAELTWRAEKELQAEDVNLIPTDSFYNSVDEQLDEEGHAEANDDNGNTIVIEEV
ncbi:MAG: hypothetical protein ACOY4Q_09045 [Bacillota bacterium]